MEEIPALLEEASHFTKFSQITDSRIIQRARGMKNQFGEEFFHPDVLAAIVNYNLVFGKKFNELIQEVVREVRRFAAGGPEASPADISNLLRREYRANPDALQDLQVKAGEPAVSEPKAQTTEEKPTVSSEAKPTSVEGLETSLLEMGIDPGR